MTKAQFVERTFLNCNDPQLDREELEHVFDRVQSNEIRMNKQNMVFGDALQDTASILAYTMPVLQGYLEVKSKSHPAIKGKKWVVVKDGPSAPRSLWRALLKKCDEARGRH